MSVTPGCRSLADPAPLIEPVLHPFAGRTGQGVRVAIVDSGVHPDHPHINAASLAPGAMILPNGTIIEEPGATLDQLGHGTAVTAAFQEKAPGATSIPVRVFRDALKTSATALVGAIRWSIDRHVDIINLSLGSLNPAHEAAFRDIAREAVEAGVLLIAAREANGSPCYPGALPDVMGVAVDWDMDRQHYRLEESAEAPIFVASGYPRPIPGVLPQRNLYGISFAVAQVSGFAALACEGWVGDRNRLRVEALRQTLITEADRFLP